MSFLALVLLLLAACSHVAWNVLLKGSQNRVVFTFWFHILMLIFFLPIPVFMMPAHGILNQAYTYIIISGAAKGIYLIMLGRAYSEGDFSVVYPVARGSAPLWVSLWAIIFLREPIHIIGGLGIALIALGIARFQGQGPLLGQSTRSISKLSRKAIIIAMASALFTSCYTTVDKVGVSLLNPFLYNYLFLSVSMLTLAAFLAGTRGEEKRNTDWRRQWPIIALAGILCFGTQLLVLFAMQISLVSYLSAVRESSIVVGTVVGGLFLGEKHLRMRLSAAGLMFIGIILLLL